MVLNFRGNRSASRLLTFVLIVFAAWCLALLFVASSILFGHQKATEDKGSQQKRSSATSASIANLTKLLEISLLHAQNLQIALSDILRELQDSCSKAKYSHLGLNESKAATGEVERMRMDILNRLQQLLYFSLAESKRWLSRENISAIKEAGLAGFANKIAKLWHHQSSTIWAEIQNIQVNATNEITSGWKKYAMKTLTLTMQRRLVVLQPKKLHSCKKTGLQHVKRMRLWLRIPPRRLLPDDGVWYKPVSSTLQREYLAREFLNVHDSVINFQTVAASATNRTFILDTDGWTYPQGSWDFVFRPLSLKCNLSHIIAKEKIWLGQVTADNPADTVWLPIAAGLAKVPQFMPLAIPKDISEDLINFHGNPPAWWIGQFARFVFHFQSEFANELYRKNREMFFKHPIVGVHIRRTDKISAGEASFHALEEYMFWVEEYFKQLDYRFGRKVNRRVFLATDDELVFSEAQHSSKYRSYAFVGNTASPKLAQPSSRYFRNESLHDTVNDIHLLSLCDYIVCTFSSNVCRLAYALMQTYHVDAATQFHSLDDIFYFDAQLPHEQTVILRHVLVDLKRQAGELEMEVNDVIRTAGNHWDGWSKGTNLRTGTIGLYPSYKVKEKFRIVDFPVLSRPTS